MHTGSLNYIIKGGKMFLFLHRNVKALPFGPFIHPDVMQETPGIDVIFF